MKKISIVSAKDCDISYFVGRGAGGQNKQKNHTGVLILHRVSGAIGRCSETRSQLQNKKQAFLNLTKTPKFKLWLSQKLFEIRSNRTLTEVVEEMMQPRNLDIQIKDNQGNWMSEKCAKPYARSSETLPPPCDEKENL